MRPHIITLGYKDLKRPRSFYERGLGFKASSASQDAIVFYPTGVTLAYNVEKKKEVAKVLSLGIPFSNLTGTVI